MHFQSNYLAGCNSQSEIYNLRFFTGVLAQLVERLNGIEEVTGSNPVGSTTFLPVKKNRARDGEEEDRAESGSRTMCRKL